jgi:hypothetical protein
MVNSKGAVDNHYIDPEWLMLILKAKELGIKPEEIRDFLHQIRSSSKEKVDSK